MNFEKLFSLNGEPEKWGNILLELKEYISYGDTSEEKFSTLTPILRIIMKSGNINFDLETDLLEEMREL